jgi:hypothetical protein
VALFLFAVARFGVDTDRKMRNSAGDKPCGMGQAEFQIAFIIDDLGLERSSRERPFFFGFGKLPDGGRIFPDMSEQCTG